MREEDKAPDGNAYLPDLISGLQYARSIYMPDGPDHGRFSAKAGLAACIQFALRAVPNGIHLAMPLRELLDGLDELDIGLRSPMLRHKAKRGGHQNRRGIETFRAMAAVLMEIYIWEGKERDEAAKAAAQELNQHGYRDERGNPISATRVEDWRDRVNEGGDNLGANRFKAMCRDLRAFDHEGARQEVFNSLSLIPGTRIPSGARSNKN